MIEENIGLVYHVLLNRFSGTNRRCHDDLISEGMMGLMEAAANFDPNRGMKFSTYACRRIYWRMLAWLKRERGVIYIPKKPKYPIPVVGIDDPDFKVCENEEFKVWEYLEGEDADLIKAMYLEKESVPEIAKRLGVSKTTIYTRHDKILEKLRKCL